MRHAKVYWNLPEGTPTGGGVSTHSWESIHAALLMDIRDELQALNALLQCPNFRGIPWTLKGIRANTAKPKRKAATKRRAA